MKYFKYLGVIGYSNVFNSEICTWYYISEQEIIDKNLPKFINDLKGWSNKLIDTKELLLISWIKNNKAIEVSETEYILKYKSPETENERPSKSNKIS